MELNPAAFNAHFHHMGQDLLWRKSYSCPCKNPHSGAARANCLLCGGKSVYWADPVEASAAPSGQKTQLQWAQFGQYQSGDLVISIPEDSPLYEMGQFDRVVTLNSTDHFSLSLTRGQNDRLFIPVESILRVFWLSDTGTIIEGGIPERAANGDLSWSSGSPPAGAQYSISGTRYSEYFCWGPFPADRNMHHGARLPRKAILRTFDLFGR